MKFLNLTSPIACGIKIAIFCFILSACGTNSVMAWQFQDHEDQMKQQFRDSLVEQESAMKARLVIRIADLDRACQLDDPQTKKLRLAAKGAVKACMVKAKQEIAEHAKAMGLEFDPDELEPEPKEENKQAEEGVAEALFGGIHFGMSVGETDSRSVEQEKIWMATVKKVLTDEQQTLYGKWENARNDFQEQAAVAAFIARVDRQLLLTNQQREQLTQVIGDKYGARLRERSSDFNGMDTGRHFQVGHNIAVVNGAVIVETNVWGAATNDSVDSDSGSTKLVKDILGPDQIEQWKQSFEGELQNHSVSRTSSAIAPMQVIGRPIKIREVEKIEEEK